MGRHWKQRVVCRVWACFLSHRKCAHHDLSSILFSLVSPHFLVFWNKTKLSKTIKMTTFLCLGIPNSYYWNAKSFSSTGHCAPQHSQWFLWYAFSNVVLLSTPRILQLILNVIIKLCLFCVKGKILTYSNYFSCYFCKFFGQNSFSFKYWVLDVGKCREINVMKTILSLSCEFTIPAPYLLVQHFPKLMCKFQLGFSKKPSHIEMRFYFISTIPANYMTITDFQFVGNPALSAKLGRCQKCTEYFSENH